MPPPAPGYLAESPLPRPSPPKLVPSRPDRAETTEKRLSPPKLAPAGTVWALEAVRGFGEAEISRLAAMQHGCAHRYQLEAAGLSRRAVARRVQKGSYARLHVDVLLVRHALGDPLTSAMAAVLQLRGNAIISGLSAARIWRIWGDADPGQVEATLVGSELGRPRGLRVRRLSRLPPHEIRRCHGVPLTSPSRTLLDLAVYLAPLELEAALANARRLRLVRDSDLRRTLTSAPATTAGITRLRDLLDGETSARDTRSVYERKLLALIELAQLPKPLTNVNVAGHMVDLFWPEAGLVVEFDSWTFHRDRKTFETDRLRDQNLALHGLRVARVTAHQIDQRPHATVARLTGALVAARLAARGGAP